MRMSTYKWMIFLALWAMIEGVYAQKSRKSKESGQSEKKILSKRAKKPKTSEKISKDTYVLVRTKMKKVSDRRLLILTRKMNKKSDKSGTYLGDKEVQVTTYELKKREDFKEDKAKDLFTHKADRQGKAFKEDKAKDLFTHKMYKKRKEFKEDNVKTLLIHKRKRLWVIELENNMQYLYTKVFKRSCVPKGAREKDKPPKYDKHEREIWFD